jgi:hypothetical protein
MIPKGKYKNGFSFGEDPEIKKLEEKLFPKVESEPCVISKTTARSMNDPLGVWAYMKRRATMPEYDAKVSLK